MKKILLCSPVRGGVSTTYVKTLLAILFSKANKIFGGNDAPYDVKWAATSGTSVAMARDTLAHLFLKENFDTLVFWDIDLGAFNSDMTVAMFERLLSHDVEVVAGQYVGHNFLSRFHGATIEGAIPDKNGLMEMAQIPLGWSAIKRSALLKIKEAHPERTYQLKQTQDVTATPNMFEFFPNGVTGPCSAYGKLARMESILPPGGNVPTEKYAEKLQEVMAIIADSNYSTNVMLGEDYYFCQLARESGVKLHIDNNLIIPHDTGVRLPVNNQQILAALTEPWRLDNDADELSVEKVKALLGELGKHLTMDIP